MNSLFGQQDPRQQPQSPQFNVAPLQSPPPMQQMSQNQMQGFQQAPQQTPLIPIAPAGINPPQLQEIPMANVGQQKFGQLPLVNANEANPMVQAKPVNLDDMKFMNTLHDTLKQPESQGLFDQSIFDNFAKTREEKALEIPELEYVNKFGTEEAVKSAFAGGSYYDIASNMLGKTEGADHAILSDVFKKQLGQNIDPRETPWCAAFVNSVLKEGGQKGTGSLAARSFLDYGQEKKLGEASKGDIAVFRRGNDETKGHVGFIDHISEDGKTVYVLGGNQGNQVSIKPYPTASLLGVRTPPAPGEVKQAAEAVNGNYSSMVQNAHPALNSVIGAIQRVETGGEKNPFQAVGKATKSGDRAYGFSQIMGSNIPVWGKEATGRKITVEEYRNSPKLQQEVTAYKINQLLAMGHSPQDVASIWFTGRPLKKVNPNVKDAYGTTNAQYQAKFNKGFNGSNI